MINLYEMFEKCKNADDFIRISDEYKNEIYIGINSRMQKTLVIRGGSKQKRVKSSKNINVDIIPKKNNKVSLVFSLIDDQYSTAFYKFCEDIIKNTRYIEKNRVIVHTIARWKIWREMFDKTHISTLSVSQVKGLIGELLFLKYYLSTSFDIQKAINSWTGPEGNPKDYYCDDTWYEIKTIQSSMNSVGITSFEQLDFENIDYGYLVVIKLIKVSKETISSVNLNSLVFDIIRQINDPYLLEDFNRKLQSVGYNYSEVYDELCFKHKNTVFYQVDESFPCLRKDNVPQNVVKVTYELSLNSLKEESVLQWNF